VQPHLKAVAAYRNAAVTAAAEAKAARVTAAAEQAATAAVATTTTTAISPQSPAPVVPTSPLSAPPTPAEVRAGLQATLAQKEVAFDSANRMKNRKLSKVLLEEMEVIEKQLEVA
jgi:hypothetical protein